MKIKKIYTLILAIWLISNSALAQKNISKPAAGYQISGELKGLKDKTTIGLFRFKSLQYDTLAVLKSTENKFVFTGKLEPEEAGDSFYVCIIPNTKSEKRLKDILVHMENADISILGSIDSLDNVEIRGSGAHDDFIALSRELTKLGDPREYKTQTLNWVKAHPNSLIAPSYVLRYAKKSEYQEYYDALAERVKSGSFGRQLYNALKMERRNPTDEIGPELNLKDVSGEAISLQDIVRKNKVIIVDFWAYYCHPCRGSFPKLKVLYSKYHEKGFEIYGVSTDPDAKKWVKALNEDNLPWINVIEEKGKGVAVARYGVTGIPAYFVLDDNGKILEKFLGFSQVNEAKLEKILEERLGK